MKKSLKWLFIQLFIYLFLAKWHQWKSKCSAKDETFRGLNIMVVSQKDDKRCLTTSWQLDLQLSSQRELWANLLAKRNELTYDLSYELTYGLTQAVSMLVTKGRPPSAVRVPHPNIRVPLAPVNSMRSHNAAALPKTLWVRFSNVPLARRLTRHAAEIRGAPATLSAPTWTMFGSASADWGSLDELAQPVGTQTCNMSPWSA